MRQVNIDRVAITWGEGNTRGGLAVILKEQNGDRSVPIWYGWAEGQALLFGLQHVPGVGPRQVIDIA